MKWCTSCRLPAPEDATNCQQCGSVLTDAGVCQWCGEPLPPGETVCGGCSAFWGIQRRQLVWAIKGKYKCSTDWARVIMKHKAMEWSEDEIGGMTYRNWSDDSRSVGVGEVGLTAEL